jgi:hypothetical protein
MSVIIPLLEVPAQNLTTILNGQSTTLNVYQRSTGLFMDVILNNSDVLVIGGVICLNKNFIVRNAYLGFSGDLGFYDTQGEDDPDYTGLAGRFILLCFSADELADNPVYALQ